MKTMYVQTGGPLSDRFIVSSSSSGRLGGGGGRKVLRCLIFNFSCPPSLSHYIVGLIAGGLELVRISGEISVGNTEMECFN